MAIITINDEYEGFDFYFIEARRFAKEFSHGSIVYQVRDTVRCVWFVPLAEYPPVETQRDLRRRNFMRSLEPRSRK